jgi:putative oligomerization/nucleic acid binding protein
MGYVIKATLGLVLFVGALVVFNVKLVSLLETGTCASGNTPYQIAKPCPSGTGTDILLLTGSVFAGLIGAGLFSARGNPPWRGARQFDLSGDFTFGTFAWGLGFTATGANALIAGLTNEAVKQSSGAQLGALIVGGTFLVMGAPALALSLWWLVKGRGSRDGGARTVTATASASGGSGWTSGFGGAQQAARNLPWLTAGGSSGGTGGQIARLERLQRLREAGALTDAEFEREKAKILSE